MMEHYLGGYVGLGYFSIIQRDNGYVFKMIKFNCLREFQLVSILPTVAPPPKVSNLYTVSMLYTYF